MNINNLQKVSDLQLKLHQATNARILKKMSKRLKQVAPKLFKDSWVDSDICEQSWKEGNRIRNIESIGGGLDEWGEGTDYQTLFDFMKTEFIWLGDFDSYPEGHEWEGLPKLPSGYKLTTIKMIQIAKNRG